MSRGYILSAPARHDLDEILGYAFFEGGPSAVRLVMERFGEAFTRLAAFPHIGHASEHLPLGCCRVWSVFDYLVIYNPDPTPLEIVRIIHGARDLGEIPKPR